MQTVTQEKLKVQILKVGSPILPQRAWQIESFLLKILEHGDYSFRKALTGQLDRHLKCTFFIAQKDKNILAAAGCLYSPDNPAVAILGPVCTELEYRRKGLSTQICGFLLEHLEAQKVQVVYLGVKDNVPAVNLYKNIGFKNYTGIVMRKLLIDEDEFNRRYSPPQETIVRKLSWQDFAEVSAFLCKSADMYTFDFKRKIFSTRYIKPLRFLSVFPEMMNDSEKNGGCDNILQTKEYSSIVGIARINIEPFTPQSHIAFLDFFVLDGFCDKAEELARNTIEQSALSSRHIILCYCLGCDVEKLKILKSLGAKLYSILPAYVNLNSRCEDIVIYRL